MEIFKLLSITLGAILANNFIFSQFLGCCPFLGVSKKVDTAVGMGVAVTFVMGLASAVCFVVNKYILIPLDLAYMQTVAFILVIASLVQFIEMFLQKAMPIVLFASIRERLVFADYPKCWDGFPIALITAGLMALAFMGFSGLKVW